MNTLFQRRHYVALAGILRSRRPVAPVKSHAQYVRDMKAWDNMCIAFCRHLAADNPRFNLGRFIEACGSNDDIK